MRNKVFNVIQNNLAFFVRVFGEVSDRTNQRKFFACVDRLQPGIFAAKSGTQLPGLKMSWHNVNEIREPQNRVRKLFNRIEPLDYYQLHFGVQRVRTKLTKMRKLFAFMAICLCAVEGYVIEEDDGTTPVLQRPKRQAENGKSIWTFEFSVILPILGQTEFAKYLYSKRQVF